VASGRRKKLTNERVASKTDTNPPPLNPSEHNPFEFNWAEKKYFPWEKTSRHPNAKSYRKP